MVPLRSGGTGAAVRSSLDCGFCRNDGGEARLSLAEGGVLELADGFGDGYFDG